MSTPALPSVTVVFLAYNRREELRHSLTHMLETHDYDRDRLDFIVVDNASADGTAEMVRRDFPGARLVVRSVNNGVSGWNDGFAVATGDYVLALDDDCHLPGDGLRRAVAECEREEADLVSFGVESSKQPGHRFDLEEYITGLLSYWGCAVLMRRSILDTLGGYDPEIFVWANELELMLRFFDNGFRHLHLRDVVAVHAKRSGTWPGPPVPFPEFTYRMNRHNFGYIAAKLLAPRDAVEALLALATDSMVDGGRLDPIAYRGVIDAVRGFRHGLAHRRPVRPHISRTYRRNFETFASPWWLSRPLRQMVRDAVHRQGISSGRRDEWRAERPRFYPPEHRGVLEL